MINNQNFRSQSVPRPSPSGQQYQNGQARGAHFDQVQYNAGNKQNNEMFMDGPPQRSMTMPASIDSGYGQQTSHVQTVSNSMQHNTQAANDEYDTGPIIPYDDGYYGAMNASQSTSGRESIGDVIDLYSQQLYSQPNGQHQQNGNASNYSRPVQPNNMNQAPVQAQGQAHTPIHRSRSQPNFNANYAPNMNNAPPMPSSGGFQGDRRGTNDTFERSAQSSRPMPPPNGDYAFQPPPPIHAGNFPGQRANSPAPSSHSTQSVRQGYPPEQQIPPRGDPRVLINSRAPSVVSSMRSEPYTMNSPLYPPKNLRGPVSVDNLSNQVSQMSIKPGRTSLDSRPSISEMDPDALPAHPAPYRPGLVQQNNNNPPSQRRDSPSASFSDEANKPLDVVREEARNQPQNMAAQFRLVKALVNASRVVPSEGTSASDAKNMKK